MNLAAIKQSLFLHNADESATCGKKQGCPKKKEQFICVEGVLRHWLKRQWRNTPSTPNAPTARKEIFFGNPPLLFPTGRAVTALCVEKDKVGAIAPAILKCACVWWWSVCWGALLVVLAARRQAPAGKNRYHFHKKVLDKKDKV